MRKTTISHPAADALDWDEAIRLINSLNDDGRYRDAMLICIGCNLGLRISDILLIRWSDLLKDDTLVIKEKKTGKKRSLKINSFLKNETILAYENLGIEKESNYIFIAWNNDGDKPFTRCRAHQILKEIQSTYGIRSAKVFSTHSLRKTFGRRVWLSESEKGRGETALVLLSEIFGHSSIAITKRYLGIRQQELLSVYDSIVS